MQPADAFTLLLSGIAVFPSPAAATGHQTLIPPPHFLKRPIHCRGKHKILEALHSRYRLPPRGGGLRSKNLIIGDWLQMCTDLHIYSGVRKCARDLARVPPSVCLYQSASSLQPFVYYRGDGGDEGDL